jgi:penicillin-binding protein 1B
MFSRTKSETTPAGRRAAPDGGPGWAAGLPAWLRPGRRWILPGAIAAVLLAVALPLWLLQARVSALREFRAAAPGWIYPSHVYSDWIDLDARHDLPRGYLEASLLARGYHPAGRPLAEPGTFAAVGGGLEVYLRAFAYPESLCRPARVRLEFAKGRLSRVLVGRGGLRAPRLEPVLLRVYSSTDNPVERTFVRLEEIPPAVRAALVSAEDRRFFQHLGVDVRGTGRALYHNVRGGGGLQGGSTLTQQLARSLFLSRRRSLGRKLEESALAVGLELVLRKRDILEMYLNSVYLGNAGPVEIGGVAEGARYFFDKSVHELTLPEAALLIGVIPAPNLYSPFRSPKLALARRNQVLRDMVEAGRLDSTVARRAMAAPLTPRRGRARPVLFPFFTDYAVAELGRHLPPGDLESRGLRVFTTLDPVWQSRAETQLALGVADVERWYGRRGPQPLEGAACLLEPGSGRVRALVGGRDYRRSPFNRATQSLRQPGSAFKPIIYAAAFDRHWRDKDFSAATTVPDLPREFPTPEGPWRPRNDDGTYHERVTLARALAKSLNVATANLTERIGPRTVAQYAARLGLGGVRPVISIGLGTSEVTPAQLAAVFATLQNDGVRVEPQPLRLAVAAGGRVEFRPAPPHERVFQATAARLTVQLLRGVVDFGTAYSLKSQCGFFRPAAGKTGTTDDYKDAWFVGFTPDVLCAVWLGYDQPTPLGDTAAGTAVPVWARIVAAVLAEFPPRPLPEPAEFEFALIDPYSGGLATPYCPSRMRAAFLRGTAPARVCGADHSAEWMVGPLLEDAAAESLTVVESGGSADSLSAGPPAPAAPPAP